MFRCKFERVEFWFDLGEFAVVLGAFRLGVEMFEFDEFDEFEEFEEFVSSLVFYF